MHVRVLKILGLAIATNIYFNISLRFSTTHFSTGEACAPLGPPLKSPMYICAYAYAARANLGCTKQYSYKFVSKTMGRLITRYVVIIFSITHRLTALFTS